MAETHKALLDAATAGDIASFEKARAGLPKGTSLSDVKDDSGRNALHLAGHHGHLDLLAHLFDGGEEAAFDANSPLDAQGVSPLGAAVAANQPQVVTELLQRGGDAAGAGPHGPHLFAACSSGFPEVAAALLSDGKADPNAVGNNGMAAVFIAAAMAGLKLKLPGREAEAEGAARCMEVLLSAGASPNVAAPGGFTPLHVAAEAGSQRMLGALLKAGADASAKTEDGQTPAAVAAAWGHRGLAETLLRQSAGDERGVDELIAEAEAREAARRAATAAAEGDSGAASLIPAPEDPNESKAEELRAQGNKEFMAGEYEAALEAYRTALRHKTNSAALWANSAAAAMKVLRFEDALRDARVSRTVDPKFVKGWYREGQAAERLGLWDDAGAAFFEAHLLQPNAEGGVDFAEMVKSAVEEGKAAFKEKTEREAGGGGQ